MKLIVGLGNPGLKYKNSRHNTGFMYLDYLINELFINNIEEKFEYNDRFKAETAKLNLNNEKIFLVKPMTYMNESGWSVSQFINWNKIKNKDLLVIHDDLDIPLGKFKYSYGKGPKLHYGVGSIEMYLKSADFNRLRIGIDNRKSLDIKIDGINYVLSKFLNDESNVLLKIFQESSVLIYDFIKS